MSDSPLKILVIAGTVRQGRASRKIADWYIAEARSANPLIQFELLDLADLNLPIFGEAMPPMMGRYNELQQQVADKVGEADGFVFIVGEYNRSLPGSLKNFLDYVYKEWVRKPAAYVGYGIHGGVRSIGHLEQIMVSLEAASIKHAITIAPAHMAVGADGSINTNFVHGDVNAQIEDLSWWARALKDAKNKYKEAA